jgi:hypothetical protein
MSEATRILVLSVGGHADRLSGKTCPAQEDSGMKQRASKVAAALAAAMTTLAIIATTAFAQEQYPGGGGVGGEVTGGGNGGEVAGTTVSGQGDLPFTGADLMLYVVAGLAVIAAGIVLRRMSGRTSS